ncbi:MAG: tyrosine-type recombinase/integrase [Phycisphaeraceae bacterium]|nr:tyrosine-type recombinase/integrase [Phycisphaerales bacterium]QOJ18505.1 MAG: tyrosine-type recombinase/integrase [Phycisphaeraceae bacterium]
MRYPTVAGGRGGAHGDDDADGEDDDQSSDHYAATRHRHANATRDDEGRSAPTPPHGHDVGARARSKPLRRYPPEVLSDAEVAALLAACREDSPAGIRNRALLTVLYRAGLRITETLALRLPVHNSPRTRDGERGASARRHRA